MNFPSEQFLAQRLYEKRVVRKFLFQPRSFGLSHYRWLCFEDIVEQVVNKYNPDTKLQEYWWKEIGFKTQFTEEFLNKQQPIKAVIDRDNSIVYHGSGQINPITPNEVKWRKIANRLYLILEEVSEAEKSTNDFPGFYRKAISAIVKRHGFTKQEGNVVKYKGIDYETETTDI